MRSVITARLALLAALVSIAFAGEASPVRIGGIPTAADPFIVLSLPWRDVNSEAYKQLAQAGADTPESVWAKAQVALDRGELEPLVACYAADSQERIRNQYREKISKGPEKRKDITLSILGVASIDMLAVLVFEASAPGQKKFPWVDQLVAENGWHITMRNPINSPLVMTVSALSYATNEKQLLDGLPAQGFFWFRLAADGKLARVADPAALAKDGKSLLLGIAAKSVVKERFSLDAYAGDDVQLRFLRKAAMALREKKPDAVTEHFDAAQEAAAQIAFQWHSSDGAKRQTLVHADFATATDRYLVLGDDAGPKSVCILRTDVDPPRIIFNKPKSGPRALSPFVVSTDLIPRMIDLHARGD